ncbi:MAG: hypothetical protein A4E51_00778 [Methanosaeta sp. PtaU1.Bin055]|nr:MAG: hypothetical protein A4E51_00778 [Methanosaeta sp. PtaU1.Bin055]
MDLDIFFPSRETKPLTAIALGQREGGYIATWWYRKKRRWFATRSLPEDRRSTGYQYSNSARIFRTVSSGSPARSATAAGSPFPRNM